MPFVKETFRYLKKSVFALLVLAVVPAFVSGLFFPFFSTFSFIPLYVKASVTGFREIFWMIFAKTGITHVYPVLLAFLAIIIFGSYILSVLEKDFKTGKLILYNPFRSVNNSMLTVLKIFPLGLGIIVILMFLQVLLVSLVTVLAASKIFESIWTALLSVLFLLAIVAVMVFMGVWAVIIQIFGFSFSDAFVEAMRITSRKAFSLVGGFLLPVAILIIPLIVFNSLPQDLNLVRTIVNVAVYLLIIVYYFAYIMVSVYMLTGLERRGASTAVPKNLKYK